MRPLTRFVRPVVLLRTSLATTVLMGGLAGTAWAQQAPPPPPGAASEDSYEALQQPATRESVRADLIRLEQAGYDPNGDHATYPEKTQAAVQRAYPPTRAQYPVADTGQSPVTRREVHDDLARLEQAGYRPEDDAITYPQHLREAERKVGDIGPGD